MAADEPSPRPLKRLPTKLLASRVQEPIFESYMFKQSHILNGFNKRYFVLFPGYLVYYTSEHDYKVDHQKGNLAHRHGAVKLDGLYLTKPEKKPAGAKYLFILHAPHKANKRHEYLLVCQTRDLRSQWMRVLQTLNPNLVPHHLNVPGLSPGARRRSTQPMIPKHIVNAMSRARKRDESGGPEAVESSLDVPHQNRKESHHENSHPVEIHHDDDEDEDHNDDHHNLEEHEGLSDHEQHEPEEDEEHNPHNESCHKL